MRIRTAKALYYAGIAATAFTWLYIVVKAFDMALAGY